MSQPLHVTETKTLNEVALYVTCWVVTTVAINLDLHKCRLCADNGDVETNEEQLYY